MKVLKETEEEQTPVLENRHDRRAFAKLKDEYDLKLVHLGQQCLADMVNFTTEADREKVIEAFHKDWKTIVTKSRNSKELVEIDINALKNFVSEKWERIMTKELMTGPISKEALLELGFTPLALAMLGPALPDANLNRWLSNLEDGFECYVSDQVVLRINWETERILIHSAHRHAHYTTQDLGYYNVPHLVGLLSGLKLESVSPYVPEEPVSFFGKLRRCFNS